MNVASQIHPTQHQLASFLAGRLDLPESGDIEQHLAECESCCQVLKVMPDDDTLVSLLRGSEDVTSVSPDQAVDSRRIEPTVVPVAQQLTLPPAGSPTESADANQRLMTESLPGELHDHPRYRVTELLGKGGMGDVYKAHHRLMNRPVALKLINGELVQSENAVKRFHREVQAAARLSHPNIVTAYDAEQAGDAHFLVMEFVDGLDLGEVVRQRGPMPVAEACECIRQAATGLQHAHERGMVHRDIKPHNLMMSRESKVESREKGNNDESSVSGLSTLDSRPLIRILDFGLANFATEMATEQNCEASQSRDTSRVPTHLTMMGSMMGTPDYISPEQARDAHLADIRSDIYSLGCTLYFLLTGRPPFTGDSMLDKIMAHVEREPQPLRDFRSDVPADLQNVLQRMMAKNPDERIQTPAEVAEVLAPFARPAALPPRRRARTFMAATIAGAAMLLAGVIVIATNRGRVVIQSEVDDVKIAVLEGGEQIDIIDLKTGSQVKWLPTGKYELQLVGKDNDIKLENNSFQMTRLGQVIVTARWNTEGRGAIRSFTVDDQPITRDGVEVADGGWKVTAADTRTVRLFEAMVPPLAPGPFFYRAKLKSENVKVRAYLEMWVRFPGEGEFFSKGFHNAVSGTNGWAEYEIPFFLKKGQQPDLAKLNLTIEGSGTVWIKDIEVRGRRSASDAPQGNFPTDADTPDETRLQGKWIAVSGHARKNPLTAAELAQLSITFDGDRVEIVSHTGPRTPQAATFTINSNRDPKQIDFVAPNQKEAMPGIYEFDGERLKLALIDQDYSRPTNFEPDHRPDHLTLVLERVAVDVALNDEERDVLKAAEAFLALVDADKFDQLFDIGSNLAKKQATREQILQTYQTIRSTLGKLEKRTLKRVRLIDEFIGLPAGRYAAVQFVSDFEKHRGLWETVMLNVDDDGQWRANTYAATVQPLPLPESKKDPVMEQKKQAARAAADDWLKLVDAGNYGESWEPSAKVNRDSISKEKMTEVYKELFAPLGAVKSRAFKSSEYTTQLPRTPVGDYVVIQFTTQFTSQRIVETVVLTKEADGQWRVSGYFHADAPITSTPLPATSKPPQNRAGLLTNPPTLPSKGVPVGRNLIVDSSLEETPTGELPQSWFAWLDDGPDFKCEVVEGGVTGKHCLQISGTGTRGVVFATSIPLDRTKRYALKGRVKVEGETGTWAVIKLNYFNNTGWLGVDDRVGVTSSDLDWKFLEKTDLAEKYPAATLLVPTCHLEGSGTAWFDDLEVIAYDREKLPENFDAKHGRNNRMK